MRLFDEESPDLELEGKSEDTRQGSRKVHNCWNSIIPYLVWGLYIAPCAWLLCCPNLVLTWLSADLGTPALIYILQGWDTCRLQGRSPSCITRYSPSSITGESL